MGRRGPPAEWRPPDAHGVVTTRPPPVEAYDGTAGLGTEEALLSGEGKRAVEKEMVGDPYDRHQKLLDDKACQRGAQTAGCALAQRSGAPATHACG